MKWRNKNNKNQCIRFFIVHSNFADFSQKMEEEKLNIYLHTKTYVLKSDQQY